jgi:Asp-tRNA(Asn)/Glu-tRNA(Gln) amidotransferase A subunit family amidase
MVSEKAEAPWKTIVRQKRAQRDAAIPRDWRLDPKYLPREDHEPENVVSVPGRCGILTAKELQITSNYQADSLIREVTATRLTAEEVAIAFCKRAAIAQQLTNCLTEPLCASAIARAKSLDTYLTKHGRPLGPLHGLPVSMKDTFKIAGVDSTIGVAALCFKPAKANSSLVHLLLSLGCVIIAKTNLPQALAALECNNNVFGLTMNPINRQVTAGGSSGGEAVLVAMKGSMIGVGIDTGGSVRIPAMCNGVYGFKPSVGRALHGGQEARSPYDNGRVGLPAVTGPITRSMQDLSTFLREIVPRAEMCGEDRVSGSWKLEQLRGSGDNGKFVIGILRRDGNCEPLPPILKVLDEVKHKLSRASNVTIVDIPTPTAWTKCQSLAEKFIGADGTDRMADLHEETSEPFAPGMQAPFKRVKATPLADVRKMQAERSTLERQMLDVWYATSKVDGPSRKRKIDAIICPVAPHPAPPIDHWNGVGYTSSFALLDYPAGVIPVRTIEEEDLELGKEMGGKVMGSWDEQNRQLWDERITDRKIYLGTSLSIQVVTPKWHDWELYTIMEMIDRKLNTAGRESKL